MIHYYIFKVYCLVLIKITNEFNFLKGKHKHDLNLMMMNLIKQLEINIRDNNINRLIK